MKTREVMLGTVPALAAIALTCTALNGAAQGLDTAIPDAAARFPPPSHLRVERDVEYARYGQRRLRLDIYRPPGAADPLPTIVVVRGGGWHHGGKNGFAFIAGHLADAGFAALCIEYRVTEEATFPAAVHDVKAAVRWARANAVQYGFDPNRLGAIGGSAGGQLVALIGTTGDDRRLEGDGGNPEQSSAVTAVVAMAPVTDFRLTWSRQNGKDSAAFLGHGLAIGDPRLMLASPIAHVSPRSASLMLLHSRRDAEVLHEQSVALKESYERTGRPVELVSFDDAPHDFWNYSRWFPAAMERSVAFFRRSL